MPMYNEETPILENDPQRDAIVSKNYVRDFTIKHALGIGFLTGITLGGASFGMREYAPSKLPKAVDAPNLNNLELGTLTFSTTGFNSFMLACTLAIFTQKKGRLQDRLIIGFSFAIGVGAGATIGLFNSEASEHMPKPIKKLDLGSVLLGLSAATVTQMGLILLAYSTLAIMARCCPSKRTPTKHITYGTPETEETENGRSPLLQNRKN